MPLKSPRASLDFLHLLDTKELVAVVRKEAVKAVEEEPLSVYLWNKTQIYQQEALHSGFIQGLKDVSLDPQAFGGFMTQDSKFCCEATKSIKKAASKAETTLVRQFLEKKAKSYWSYSNDLCNTWHIANEGGNADGIILGKACQAYVDHESYVAENLKSIYFIVAMIPCAKLWPWLGGEIGADMNTFGVYTDWVNENLNPKGDAKQYEVFINYAEAHGIIEREVALQVYTGSMKGEADFFTSVS